MARFLLHLTFLFFSWVTFAQEADKTNVLAPTMSSINVSGGDASSSSGSVAYSIGITHYTNIESPNTIISQGIQQSLEIEAKVPSESKLAHVMAYPNPTTNYIMVDLIDYKSEPAQFQIFSSSGVVLKTGSITTGSTKLAMQNFSSGAYFIRVNVLNKFEETLKIVKH